MANSKVVYGNTTLIDITDTSAVESDVISGYTFHKANGSMATGNKTPQSSITVSGTKLILPGGVFNKQWSTMTQAEKVYAVQLYEEGWIILDDYFDVNWSTSSLTDVSQTIADAHNGILPISKLKSFWNGQERSITLNDNKTVVYVFEGKQYTLSDSNLTYKGLSIYPKYVTYTGLVPRTAVNPYNAYWSSCEMRPWFNTTYYDKFPSDFKALLKQYVSDGSADDYFCPPSSNQYGARLNASGSATTYWACSPYNSWNPVHWYYIDTSGNVAHKQTNYSDNAFPIGCV